MRALKPLPARIGIVGVLFLLLAFLPALAGRAPGAVQAQSGWVDLYLEPFNGSAPGWGIYRFGNGDEVTFRTDGTATVVRVDNAGADGGGRDDFSGFLARSISIPALYTDYAIEVRLRFPERTPLGMLFSAGTGAPAGCSNGNYVHRFENILRVHANRDGAQVAAPDLGSPDLQLPAMGIDPGAFFTVRLEVYGAGTWRILVNGIPRASGTVPAGVGRPAGLHIGNYRWGCALWGNWTSLHVDYVRVQGQVTPTPTPTPTPPAPVGSCERPFLVWMGGRLPTPSAGQVLTVSVPARPDLRAVEVRLTPPAGAGSWIYRLPATPPAAVFSRETVGDPTFGEERRGRWEAWAAYETAAGYGPWGRICDWTTFWLPGHLDR